MNKLRKVITIFILFSIIINIIGAKYLFLSTKKVKAGSKLVLTAVGDAMVRENVPNKNYGTWNDMTIGEAFNYGAYFSDSQAFIKFNLSSLGSDKIIDSAYLEVYQYVRSDFASGNYKVRVSRVKSNWSELGITWGNKPGIEGNYGEVWADGFASQWFNPPKKYKVNVTNLVKKWSSGTPNYGMVLHMVSGNLGGFWCSKNYNNATCFAHSQPKLVINYRQNHPPNIPNADSPENLAEFGGDSSQNGEKVTLKVNKLRDVDNNLDGTWFYYKRNGDTNWQKSPKRTGKKSAQYTKTFPDGKWYWKARSRDKKGIWSSFSSTRTFIVDTTPPLQAELLPEPEFTKGEQNTLYSKVSNDNVIGGVSYKFKVFKDNDCNTFFYESSWQKETEITISNLSHNINYCYQVTSKDKLGNQNSWSPFVNSTQDAVLPSITSLTFEPEVFSPNGDGVFDFTNFDFEIQEQHFDSWSLDIKNSDGIKVKSLFGDSKKNTVTWNGTDTNNQVVPDGSYVIDLKAADLAGNFDMNTDQSVIVDNEPATLSISQPVNNSWTSGDKIMISGITEPNIDSLKLDGNEIEVDENGIFEEEKQVEVGSNNFELIASDIVGNISTEILNVNMETDSPHVSFISSKSVTNTSMPKIILNLTDENTINTQSGINKDSVFLSLINDNGEELILVSDGNNTQPQMGKIESDCFGDITGGKLSCEYTYVFEQDLSPDGDYFVKAQVKDFAGNFSKFYEYKFNLDTHNFIEIEEPKEGDLLSTTMIDIKGAGEIDSEVSIIGEVEDIAFKIDPNDNKVTNCREVDESFGVGWKGVGVICDFEIKNFKLKADENNDIYTLNQVRVISVDKAENETEKTLDVKVNLFAVNLRIDTDLDYISPNGDGRQDGLEFTMKAFNPDTEEIVNNISSWNVQVKNTSQEIVRTISGNDFLPKSYYFDGKSDDNKWLRDGEYLYKLEVETLDGIKFETDTKKFYVKTSIDNEVVITNPKSGFVTTRGVINVQGQAQVGTVVTICVDMIGIDGECNDEQVVEVNSNGFFTAIVPLATNESYIWAKSTDKAGNVSPRSNRVKVILDFNDPLISVKALPSLTGINSEVVLRSIVTQNTEYVKIHFSDYTNLNELPQNPQVNFIGEIDDKNDGDLNDTCSDIECVWDYGWMTPEVTGGVYEIKFTGKKGESLNTLSLGIRIDGTVPTIPTILSLINKNTGKSLRQHNSDYYTNSDFNVVKGVAEPLSEVNIKINDENKKTIKTNAIGKWEVSLELEGENSLDYFEIFSISSDKVGNESDQSEKVSIVLDKKLPEIEDIDTSNYYKQSGTLADIAFQADEDVFASKIERPDQAKFDLSAGNIYSQQTGSFTIESDANEGDYTVRVIAEDFAGNVVQHPFTYIIDNTKPEVSLINTSDWGKYSGIAAKNTIPAEGRILPGYVIANNKLKLSGKAEQFSKLQVWSDSKIVAEVPVTSKNCSGEVRAYDQVFYKTCNWNFKLDLDKNGLANLVQTKVVDRAGNESEVSPVEVVYRDQLKPKKPTLINNNTYWKHLDKNLTNKQRLQLKLHCERYSDIKFEIKGPNNFKSAKLTKCDKFGKLIEFDKLGKNKSRNWDGIYKFEFISFDAAGNRSKIQRLSVKKDTTPPEKPKLKIIEQNYNNSIKLKIFGEKNTKAKVHIYRSGIDLGEKIYNIDESGIAMIDPLSKLKWGSEYKFYVTLMDGAKNISKSSVALFNTSSITGGDYIDDDVLGENEDPYQDLRGHDLDSVNGRAVISPEGKVILDLDIPSPKITYTITKRNGKVVLWGIVPIEGSIDIDFYKKHETDYWADLEKASQMCGWKKYVPYVNSVYIPSCVKKNFTKIQNQTEFDYTIQNFKFAPQNIVLQIFVNGKKIEKEFQSDEKDGRWKITLDETLNVNDRIYSRARVWGYYVARGTRIGYNHESAFSNTIYVKKKINTDPLFKGVHTVVEDNVYYDEVITQNAFGAYSHVDNAAIDVFGPIGSEVYSTVDGTVEYLGEGAWLRNEDSDYKVLYAHLDGSSQKLYKNGTFKKVKKGDLIGYIGGLRHVHYEVKSKSTPWPYKSDCNSKIWCKWRSDMKAHLNKLLIPYDNIDFYSSYLGSNLYINGKSINPSKSNCPQS